MFSTSGAVTSDLYGAKPSPHPEAPAAKAAGLKDARRESRLQARKPDPVAERMDPTEAVLDLAPLALVGDDRWESLGRLAVNLRRLAFDGAKPRVALEPW